MTNKDYFNFFSTIEDDNTKVDYIILFNNDRPDIDYCEMLKSLGNWTEYTEKGYRILCSVSKEKLEKLISEELEITSENFKVIRAAEFAGVTF